MRGMLPVKLALLPVRQRGVCSPPAISIPRQKADRLAGMLKALADPTRLQIVGILARAREPVCICDFTAAFELSQPTVSHHMARLRQAGLVESSKKGIWSYYRLRTALDPEARALLHAVL